MISERSKQFYQASWCPPTMIIPVHHSNNPERCVNVDLSQWMRKVPEHEKNKRMHKTCTCTIELTFVIFSLKKTNVCKDARLLKCKKDGRRHQA